MGRGKKARLKRVHKERQCYVLLETEIGFYFFLKSRHGKNTQLNTEHRLKQRNRGKAGKKEQISLKVISQSV